MLAYRSLKEAPATEKLPTAAHGDGGDEDGDPLLTARSQSQSKVHLARA